MIPILYSKTVTNFVGNGIGLLYDIDSCQCTEKLNDSYELSIKMPTVSRYVNIIDVDQIVFVKPNYEDPPQAFRIYSVDKSSEEQVTISAAHIAYDTSGIPILPFTSENLDSAIDSINNNQKVLSKSPFVINSEVSAEGKMEVKTPTSFRSLLGGSDTSITKIYKVDCCYNNYTINFIKRRGKNRGICFRYGKNIASFDQTIDSQKTYSAVLGYWKKSGSEDQNDQIIYGNIIQCEGVFPYDKIYLLDTTSNVKTENNADATVDQIDEYVEKYIEENAPGLFSNTIKIDYTKDDDKIKVCVGDVVGILYTPYNVDTVARCTSVTFDCLAEKNVSIEVGTEEKDIANIIADLL